MNLTLSLTVAQSISLGYKFVVFRSIVECKCTVCLCRQLSSIRSGCWASAWSIICSVMIMHFSAIIHFHSVSGHCSLVSRWTRRIRLMSSSSANPSTPSWLWCHLLAENRYKLLLLKASISWSIVYSYFCDSASVVFIMMRGRVSIQNFCTNSRFKNSLFESNLA